MRYQVDGELLDVLLETERNEFEREALRGIGRLLGSTSLWLEYDEDDHTYLLVAKHGGLCESYRQPTEVSAALRVYLRGYTDGLLADINRGAREYNLTGGRLNHGGAFHGH